MGHVKGMTIGNATVTGLVQAVDAETGKLVVVSQVNVYISIYVYRCCGLMTASLRSCR